MASLDEEDRSADRREELMWATYRALCEQGIADLTMADIADEAGVSSALLHYHFDTKRDLLLAYVEYAQEWYESTVADIKDEHPTALAQLEAVLDIFVDDPDDEHTYNRAYLELRVQASHDDAFRDAFAARRETIIEELSGLITRGIEAGAIDGDDPDRMARNLYTFMDGARVQQVALGADIDPEEIKADALESISSSTTGD